MVEYHSMHEGRGYSYGRPLFRPQVLITQSELFALGGLFSDIVLPPTSVKGAAQAAVIKVASFLAGTVYDAISSGDYSPASPVNVAIENENYIRPGNMPGIHPIISKPSRVDSSLTSKSKTRGNSNSSKMYKPKPGEKCRSGYRKINGMCVKK
ncbi:MAG: hypothetical protein [Circular genetic element sp.]|nr:MAG: hypothetical protein [Circular genetic element sp.]